MKKILFAMIAVLSAFNAYADRMYINNFSIEAGETKQVSINLDNTNTLSAFQLELYLPNGLTMALDSRGRLRCGVNADRADDHTLTFKDRGNGQYNATYYSTNSYDIYGNSGEVVYFYVTAADNFSGTATVSLKEIYVSDAAGNMTQLDNTNCTVTGPQPVNPPAGTTSMYINDFSIEAGETKQVSINLDNSTALSAFQLELYLPEGLTMALDSRGRLRCGVNADRADDHTLTFKDRGNGQYNATYYSTNSYDIYGNSGEVVYFYVTAADNFSGTAIVSLKEIYVSDAAGNMTQLDNTSCTVTGPQPVNPPTGTFSMYINDFSIEAGETKQVSINLDNTTALSAFQLELYLPEGLKMALDSRGRLHCGVNTDRADDHTLTFKDRGNGQYNATYYSTNSYDIIGNSGEIAYFYVTAADNFSGTATVSLKEIYVSDAAGNMTKLDDSSCTVTVTNSIVKATSISLDKTTATLTTGETTTLTATVLPGNATDKSVTWTSSNTAVATVDVNGKVTAVAPGTATITVKTADGTNLTATCAVTVNALVEKATSIALDLTQFKTTETALVQVYPTIEPASAATQDVKWTSSNEEIATVDVHGRIKALKAGKVTIKATTTDGSDLSATCEVTIMLKGDMNDDFTIDVADMNAIINIILGL